MTTYATLQDLIRTGIVREIEKDKVKTFSVIDPQELFSQKQHELQRFEQLLPEFVAMADIWDNKPKITYYE